MWKRALSAYSDCEGHDQTFAVAYRLIAICIDVQLIVVISNIKNSSYYLNQI